MTSPPPDGRRFDDDEVSLILRRAGELQEARQSDAGGMSLADLESVAREAGLDPALVRQAAAELSPRDAAAAALPGPGGGFLGAPTLLRYERVVDGEVPPAEYDVLVDEIRRSMNDVGTFSMLGRTLAWGSTPAMQRGQAGSRQVSVTVVARGGRTAIRVEERVTSLAGGLFGGIMGGVGGGGSGIAVGTGLAVLHSALAAAGLWGLLIAGSYGLARTIFTRIVRRRAGQLSSLADRLAGYVEGTRAGAQEGTRG
ncbi:hypothetical protein J421_4052 [Gemmatirosa kalamazoonensis]|uniref:Uncharacterized protein n=1 Tax=Gemmatirosa kalamazoonensis TaxID=861299 RepID=W0RKH0_9BACT|nr:hypothetical protein [Gemmatirosa kalamazoonensis]AHG91589.1 hypothetical protein J421_4052 [Gemmatirosa kalamazoonensis]